MLLNKGISIAYFIRLIRWDIVGISAYAIAIGTLDQYGVFKSISIPLAVSAMIGTLVSLVLAFRTSQSYERWWEARVVWGGIVNDSRTFVRQLTQFLPQNEASAKVIQTLTQRQIIWCFALADSLRKVPFSNKVQCYLDEHNIKSGNVPNALLSKHSEDLSMMGEQFSLNDNKQVQLDNTLARLTDAMGKCERIKNTVFPKSYSLLIHFLIYVFLSIFPFGLDDSYFLMEILSSILIPLLFIAIERTAIIMQDPFENKPTDTPMTTLSKTIEGNLREMIGLNHTVEQKQHSTYYIM